MQKRGGNEWNRTLLGQNKRNPKPRWRDVPWLLAPRGGQYICGRATRKLRAPVFLTKRETFFVYKEKRLKVITANISWSPIFC